MILFATIALSAPIGAKPESHLITAWQCLRRDDFVGVRLHAGTAAARSGAHDQEALYLLGLAEQLDGSAALARKHFEAGLLAQPHGAFVDHLQFGLAEMLAEQGEPRAALRTLRKLKRHRVLDEEDGVKFAIDKALWKIELGRERRFTPRLLTLLEQTPNSVATWHQARAHSFFVDRWLDLADQLGTTEPVLVERRALFLAKAREQLDATVQLGHDRWILHQIHRLGNSFEVLGDDVVMRYGTPASLPPADREKVENVWVKAGRFYDLGERHAVRIQDQARLAQFAVAAESVAFKVDHL